MSAVAEVVAAPSTREVAEEAKVASRVLAPMDEVRRNAALEAMAQAVGASAAELFAANAEDLRVAASMSGDEALSAATISRLKLDDAKLLEMVEQIRSVAALGDPLGRVLDAVELDDGGVSPTSQKRDATPASNERSLGTPDVGHPAQPRGDLQLRKVSVPLGVLAVIFEARPDAVTQIAALAIKSGNAVILKPGREVERTAAVLVRVLREALVRVGMPKDAVSLVLGRERVGELLAMHDRVDMVIPRGSKALVEFVQANTRIPVLGHSEGVCHIYVDRAADEAMALDVIDDAKTDYAAACNAVETVLVHREIAAEFLPKLARRLRDRGVVIHTNDDAGAYFYGDDPRVKDWHTEYGELALSIGVVDSIDAAIEHIHTHGSSHTESILTEDAEAAERFLREVDAAGVFHNASTRFADGFRYGFGAEVGISTSKFHARGPVGLDGLTTYKYVLRGHGQTAGAYRGEGGRTFTHRRVTS